MIGGEPRVGDESMAEVFSATGTAAERVRLDRKPKLMARWIVRRMRHSQIAEEGLEL